MEAMTPTGVDEEQMSLLLNEGMDQGQSPTSDVLFDENAQEYYDSESGETVPQTAEVSEEWEAQNPGEIARTATKKSQTKGLNESNIQPTAGTSTPAGGGKGNYQMKGGKKKSKGDKATTGAMDGFEAGAKTGNPYVAIGAAIVGGVAGAMGPNSDTTAQKLDKEHLKQEELRTDVGRQAFRNGEVDTSLLAVNARTQRKGIVPAIKRVIQGGIMKRLKGEQLNGEEIGNLLIGGSGNASQQFANNTANLSSQRLAARGEPLRRGMQSFTYAV